MDRPLASHLAARLLVFTITFMFGGGSQSLGSSELGGSVPMDGVEQAIAASEKGAWGPVVDWNLVGIHAILTPQGKILSFGTDKSGNQGGNLIYDVWDPRLGIGQSSHQLLPNKTPTDIFCAAHILLPDSGQVLFAGGDIAGELNSGNVDTNFFDEADDEVKHSGFEMAQARWYPTLTTLPNGEIIVQGGSDAGVNGTGMVTPEIFNAKTGWRRLGGASSDYAYGDDFKRWWYPRSWILPDGRLFGISGPAMYFLDYEGEGAIQEAGEFRESNRGATSTSVMYAPGLILQVGGGAAYNSDGSGQEGSRQASIIDVRGERALISAAAPMTFSRHWANSSILPDGQVLVSGGTAQNVGLGGSGPAYWAEVWNPKTNTWKVLAAEDKVRTYHSTAILLPDATILSMGGGAPGPVLNLNAQIFSPPYLFKGHAPARRPTYTLPHNHLSYGAEMIIPYWSEAPIERVTLVKTGAVTHSFNQDQRFLELSFEVESDETLRVKLPTLSSEATPGYYMLFILDNSGVPSVAQIVHFAPS